MVLTFGLWGTMALFVQTSPVTAQPVTVCDVLNDLKAYNGKSVAVLGRWSGTVEGEWLSQDCSHPLRTGNYTWHSTLSLEWNAQASTRFEVTGLDQSAVAKALESVKKTTKLRAGDRWALVFGRLNTQELKVKRDSRSGRLILNGFGHLNGAPGEIVHGEKCLHFLPSPDAPPEMNPSRFREARPTP